MEKYGETLEEGKRYANDLRFWSNACGELHKWGKRDISERELPEDLQRVYRDRYEEGKDGHLCYLAEYKDVHGIALIEEFHEKDDDGQPCARNYEEAARTAEKMDPELTPLGVTILLAKELGVPAWGECATELVVFVPASADKDLFDRASKRFAETAFT